MSDLCECGILKSKCTHPNCGDNDKSCPALVELKDGKVITLHSELPDGAVMVDKEVSKEALKEWTLKAKEKWNDSK